MPLFVALLRAVNVGGTGKITMNDLRALCEAAGFTGVRTYIQSGNVLFRSPLPEAKVQAKLEKALAAKIGKPISVLVRTRAELEALLEHNPFKSRPGNRVLVVFLAEALAKTALNNVEIPGDEEFEVHDRELFVYYPQGMGQSKLKLPIAKTGTGRNLNTVAKLVAIARELEATTRKP